MNCFRKCCLASLLVALVAGSAVAQSPVNLGRPTRLDEPAVIRFTPVRPATNAALPPPSVVRGARALLEDDPHNEYLPRDLSPIGERKLPPPMYPIPVHTPRSAAAPIADDMMFFRVDKDVAIKIHDNPERTLPPAVESRDTIVPVRFTTSDRVIIIDETAGTLYGMNPARWYASAEYLLWWTKGFSLPPLVTTANPNDTERTRGALGFQNTRLIFGNEDTTAGPRSGGRFTVGHYLDPCGYDALEASFFFLGGKQDPFAVSTDQFAVLARPFFNVNTGMQDRQLVSTPATAPTDLFLTAGPGFRGSVQVESNSRLWGAELNLRRELDTNCRARVTGLCGFRFVELSEQLRITERIEFLQPIPGDDNNIAFFTGDRGSLLDAFATRNRFYGGQVGVSAAWEQGRWTLDTRFKIALGATCQTVDIEGNLAVDTGSTRRFFTNAGGLYALRSNIGRSSQTAFSAVPEVGVKLGYNLTDNISLYAGYDFLYWTNVLRPGDQIDLGLDANTIPQAGQPDPPAGSVRPVVPFRSTSFWAQGVSAGLLFRY